MKGIDVSYFQGSINWKKVAADGIEFVIPREGYGKSTVDSKFFSYVNGAQSAGIKIPGIYHFSYALNVDQAKTEAEFAVANAKKANLPATTIVFFDLEYDSVRYAKDNGVNLDQNLCIAMTKAFCDKVRELGFVPGVYFNVDYYKNMYAKGEGLPENTVRWLANWGGRSLYNCDFHQTSEKGKVNGISGDVDLDKCCVTMLPEPKPVEEKPALKPADDQVVADVLAGKYGNGDDRVKALEAAGYDYYSVQGAVNLALKKQEEAKPEKKEKAVTMEVVLDIIAGKYGNGDDRKKRLADEGYDYARAQQLVNNYLKNKPSVSPAKSFDGGLTGKYTVNAAALNCRFIPGVLTDNNVQKILYQSEVVQSWGYYSMVGTSKWMLIQQGTLIGWVDAKYIKRK